jgi:hypothetical protein
VYSAGGGDYLRLSPWTVEPDPLPQSAGPLSLAGDDPLEADDLAQALYALREATPDGGSRGPGPGRVVL